jgi:hypothetical protein
LSLTSDGLGLLTYCPDAVSAKRRSLIESRMTRFAPAADLGGSFFPYRFDNRWRPLFAALRVGDRDGVAVLDDRLVATFGRWHVDTPLTNIDHTEITGPHRWYTAVGLRLSWADDGITFGTNSSAGLCIAFVDKVPKVIGPRAHSALWVSVVDPAALASALVEQ